MKSAIQENREAISRIEKILLKCMALLFDLDTKMEYIIEKNRDDFYSRSKNRNRSVEEGK